MAIGPLMVDLHSVELSAEEIELLRHPLVGGVIYFARNFESEDQIKTLSNSIRGVSPDLLIAVDQEGGRVQRFRDGFTRIPSMQTFLGLYKQDNQKTLGLLREAAWLMASELLAVGVDFSFAPVLDVDDCFCDVIADRSFSPQAHEVVEMATAWINGMNDAGMAATGKHFPGHGQVNTDSHLDLPVDEREFSLIVKKDLIPFIELSDRLNAVMPAHILFPKVDKYHSVGFSSYWLQTILRKKLHFNGVIFSDDLTMEGAAKGGSYTDRARLAMSAGCDMILVCNSRKGVIEVLDNITHTSDINSLARLNKMRGSLLESSVSLKRQSRWQNANRLLCSIV